MRGTVHSKVVGSFSGTVNFHFLERGRKQIFNTKGSRTASADSNKTTSTPAGTSIGIINSMFGGGLSTEKVRYPAVLSAGKWYFARTVYRHEMNPNVHGGFSRTGGNTHIVSPENALNCTGSTFSEAEKNRKEPMPPINSIKAAAIGIM